LPADITDLHRFFSCIICIVCKIFFNLNNLAKSKFFQRKSAQSVGRADVEVSTNAAKIAPIEAASPQRSED
jgi:hypothetical protein